MALTAKEFFTAINNKYPLTDEEVAFVMKSLNAIDKRNASAKAKASEKISSEYKPLIASMREYLSQFTGVKTTAECATACDMTTPKASAVLRKMVEMGLVDTFDVKVRGKGTQKAYLLKQKVKDADATAESVMAERESVGENWY